MDVKKKDIKREKIQRMRVREGSEKRVKGRMRLERDEG